MSVEDIGAQLLLCEEKSDLASTQAIIAREKGLTALGRLTLCSEQLAEALGTLAEVNRLAQEAGAASKLTKPLLMDATEAVSPLALESSNNLVAQAIPPTLQRAHDRRDFGQRMLNGTVQDLDIFYNAIANATSGLNAIAGPQGSKLEVGADAMGEVGELTQKVRADSAAYRLEI